MNELYTVELKLIYFYTYLNKFQCMYNIKITEFSAAVKGLSIYDIFEFFRQMWENASVLHIVTSSVKNISMMYTSLVIEI